MLAVIRSHLNGQLRPIPPAGCLPAPLTCAAPKGGWIMEECGQEGVFSSPGPVCSWGCSSPLNRLPLPPPRRFAPRSLQKRWRLFRVKNRNAAKLPTWMREKMLSLKHRVHFSAVAKIQLRYWCQTVIIMLQQCDYWWIIYSAKHEKMEKVLLLQTVGTKVNKALSLLMAALRRSRV